MRKLAWFVIIVLVVALSIAVLCAYSPDFSATIYDFGVNTVGAGIVNGITGLTTGMMAWGATGLGPSVAVISGTLIAGSILWLVILKRYIWPKVKGLKQQPAQPTFQGAPVYTPPTVVQPAKAEPVKKEEEKVSP